jgi:hypothetical protein
MVLEGLREAWMAIINAQCGHRNHTMPAPFWNEPSTRRYRRPGYGVGWLIGSVVTGLLYEQSHLALVLFAVIVQLASLPVFVIARRWQRGAQDVPDREERAICPTPNRIAQRGTLAFGARFSISM